MSGSHPRTSKKQLEQERSMAESPFPIMPLKPKGVRGKWENRINYEELRAQISTPPRTPERRPSVPRPARLASPLKKRDPADSLFITRKPPANASPFKVCTERLRRASAPYSSPIRPQPIRRIVSGPANITGPAPGIIYKRVPQNCLCPLELDVEDRPLYPPDDDVVLGSYERIGCCAVMPDAVSKESLNIRWPQIHVCFQWKHYEQYGTFESRVNVPKFQDDPFDSRLEILSEVKKLFKDFRNKVSYRRSVGDDVSKPPVDILAFTESDIRVIRLERRYENLYQVVFVYPTRNDR
ncbi:hypothetical protein ACEPAF_8173 [Sanghuangporus sanghuang]